MVSIRLIGGMIQSFAHIMTVQDAISEPSAVITLLTAHRSSLQKLAARFLAAWDDGIFINVPFHLLHILHNASIAASFLSYAAPLGRY